MKNLLNSPKRKLIAIASFSFALIMVLPSGAFGQSLHSNNTYTDDGFTISIHGSTAFISMNGSTYQAFWNIESIASGTLVKQHFHILSVNRILNANQNSVVVILGNQHLQTAEIYSFTQGSIDASIAITNLAPQSNTFLATFVLVTDHRDLVSTSGFSGGSLNIPISQKTIFAPISPQSWVYNDQ